MRRRVRNREEFLREMEKLTMRIEAATIDRMKVPRVYDDSDGSPVLVKFVEDLVKIRDAKTRRHAELIVTGEMENDDIAKAYSYRDEALSELREKAWSLAAYNLELACFHEEGLGGRPYAVTFLPLLEDLEDLLRQAGFFRSRKINLNRVCRKH